MATKRPKGMSSREMAAQKAGGKLNYKTGAIVKPQLKVATKPKAVAPLVGAGPLMTGQSRVSSEGPAIGPLLENQSRPSSSKSTSSNRSQAAKAFDYSTAKSTPNSGVGGKSLAPLASPEISQGTIRQGSSSLLDRLKNKVRGVATDYFGSMGEMARNNGMRAGNLPTEDQRASNRQTAWNATLGTPTAAAQDNDISALGQYLQSSSQPDIPTGYGDQGEIFFNNFGPEDMSLQSKFQASQRNEQPAQPFEQGFSNPFSIPTAQASEPDRFRGSQSRGDGNDPSWVPQYEAPTPPTQEEIMQQQNEDFGGGPGPVDTAGPTVGNRSGRGSGAFGTGKGVMSDDPYIKELRKAYSSNGGEKWLRKQFEELIAALDPTYAQMQKEGTDALNSQLNEQNTKLASVMNAGNVGDSEQRAQLMAGQQRDTQTALGNLLAKLAQNKAGDVSQYRTQYAQERGKLADRDQSNQQRLMEQIQQYRNQQVTGAKRGATAPTMSNAKLSRNDIFNWTEDALNKGYSWQEIADNAKEQGIGTETGGYLDQLLNQANKQKRYR